MGTRVGVQCLLRGAERVEQRQAGLPRHQLVIPLKHELDRDGDPGRGLGRTYEWMRQNERRVAFWGHSHYARVWRKAEPDGPIEQLIGARVDLPADPAAVYVVLLAVLLLANLTAGRS